MATGHLQVGLLAFGISLLLATSRLGSCSNTNTQSHTVSLERRVMPILRHCPWYTIWVGRFCELDPRRFDDQEYVETCWWPSPWPQPPFPPPLTWTLAAEERGLDILRYVDQNLLDMTTGANPERIPKGPGKQVLKHYLCPHDWVCVQLTDKEDRDAVIACERRRYRAGKYNVWLPSWRNAADGIVWQGSSVRNALNRFNIVGDEHLYNSDEEPEFSFPSHGRPLGGFEGEETLSSSKEMMPGLHLTVDAVTVPANQGKISVDNAVVWVEGAH